MGQKLARILGSYGPGIVAGFTAASFAFMAFGPAVARADDQPPFGVLPASADAAPRNVLRMEVSAYTSRPQETDATPFVTASGTRVRDGIVATNRFPIGTRLRIPSIYGDKVFVVEDRMNARYGNHVDVWMDSVTEAKALGRRFLEVQVF